MNTSRLDDLPVELFYRLFNYLSAHEIFYSFVHLNSYIDAVLKTYPTYRINFKAISRSHFDLVCQNIRPDHVVALILSDDDDTPGLIDLFLLRFQVNQFIHLQVLRLISIGLVLAERIVPQLVHLKHLRTFHYFPIDHSEPWFPTKWASGVTSLDLRLFHIYTAVFPHLYQLRLSHGYRLHTIQFSHLQQLVLDRCTVDLIRHLSSAAPQLQSLDTSISFDPFYSEMIAPLPQLNRLILEISNYNVSMNQLEQMMVQLPRLKHLELIAHCNNDVIDGTRWEACTKVLRTFKFSFRIIGTIQSQQMDSFRTPFWLNDKKWFVAYKNDRFFSVLQPTAMEIDFNFELPQYTTAIDERILYQHIHHLTLKENLKCLNGYFPHVHTLVLEDPLSLSTIRKVVDLHQIHNLTLPLSMENFPIEILMNEMPNLHHLSILYDVDHFLKQICDKIPERIRTLRIRQMDTLTTNDGIGHLSTIFPHLESLHVNCLCSVEKILDFLRAFKCLIRASFCYKQSGSDKDTTRCRLNIQSNLDQIRRVDKWNFNYRFDSSRVYFWI